MKVILVPTSETPCVVPGRVTVSGITNATVPPATEWRPDPQVTGPTVVGQVTVQSVPRFAGSPTTVAPRLTTESAGAETPTGLMTIAVIVDVRVTGATAVLLRSELDRAVTVTICFAGTDVGAV